MKNSLKTFPKHFGTPPEDDYWKWKEAFEKELKEMLSEGKDAWIRVTEILGE